MSTTFLGQKVYNVSSYETLSTKSLTKKVYFKVDFSLQDMAFIRHREVLPESVKISTKSNPNRPEMTPFKVLSGYLK